MQTQQSLTTTTKVSVWQLFRAWTTVGLQSFGGGATTVFLIQREFIDRRQWISMEEYNRLTNLCFITPGINLIGITILIGRQLAGIPGILVSLLGMLLPSAAITCLIAALFKEIERTSIMHSALQGVLPATGGVMLLAGLSMARPHIKQARQEGLRGIIIGLLFVLVSFCAIAFLKLPAFLILPCAGIAGILIFKKPAQVTPEEEIEAHD